MKESNPSPFRVYIVPLMVLLTIVLLVPFVLMPQISAIKEKNLEIKKGTERLKALEDKIEALQAIDENSESLKLIEMEKIVPSGKDLAQLVVGVRSLAAVSELKVADMVFEPGKVATGAATVSASKKAKAEEGKAKKEEPKDKITFTLSLEGKLTGFKTFLEKIERAKRLLGISLIELKKEEDEKYYTFDLNVLAPFKGVTRQKDTISSPLPVLTKKHLEIYDFITNFINYTNVSIPLVPKGLKDPFR